MYSYVIEQWGITRVGFFFTYGYWVTPDGGYCVGTAMKSAKSGAQHNCSNQGSDSSEHVNNTTSGEVLSKAVKVWWTVSTIWLFFLEGGGGVLFYFFFGENDRHLLHYIEQVHPRKLKLDITVTVLFVVWGLWNFVFWNEKSVSILRSDGNFRIPNCTLKGKC